MGILSTIGEVLYELIHTEEVDQDIGQQMFGDDDHTLIESPDSDD